MYYPCETQVVPLTYIRRERVLPAPGELLVRIGDRVEPAQIVGRTELPTEFSLLPVARLLGVPASKLKRHLRVNVNDRVRKGQVIAARSGRSIKSPIDGVVTASSGGRVLIEAPPAVFELRAYISGLVSNVFENQGVVIETTGAVIQGVWGTGGEDSGVLRCLAKSPDKPLRAKDLDPSFHGTIIVGGVGLSEAVIERAQEVQARGIVTGSFPPELLPRAGAMPFPIIATEGIGATPMSMPIFRLLTTNDGREASISGQFRPRWGILRPEIVIPMPAETVPPAQSQPGSPLTVGARVRAVRAPYAGQVGTVVDLPARLGHTEVGGRVRGAEVDLGQETPVFIPLENLELLR